MSDITQHELFTAYIVACERLEWSSKNLASMKDYADRFELHRLTELVVRYNEERRDAHEKLIKSFGCRREGSESECRICPIGMCLRFNLAIIIEKHFGRIK